MWEDVGIGNKDVGIENKDLGIRNYWIFGEGLHMIDRIGRIDYLICDRIGWITCFLFW